MNGVITEQRVGELIKLVPALAGAVRVTPLGGLTNRNFRVETSTGKYVLRVSTPESVILGINRQYERINTDRAHTAGVGAALVDALPDENVLVMNWIEARTLHASDLRSESGLLARIAGSLKALHSGPPFVGTFNFPLVRARYLEVVQKAGYFIPDEYLTVEPLVKELENVLALLPEPLVPCNNDLLAENFMDDGKKIWIIDFEYSGQNEASFEIGNLASESFLTDEQVVALCEAYWGQPAQSKVTRALAWSMIARYGWVLWASIQEATSPIEFDFRAWGMIKWNSVLPELHGNRYRDILESLKNSR